MAKRKQSTFFEDLTELVAMLPWWVGLLLALVSYLWLHNLATQSPPNFSNDARKLGESVANQLWITFAMFLQYIIPFVCVLGASISAFKKYKKNEITQSSFNNLGDQSSHQSNTVANSPECPVCGTQMIKRTAKKGGRAGEAFWGCSSYPKCKGTRTIS